MHRYFISAAIQSHFPVGLSSDDPYSSAAISKNSRRYSGGAPLPDRIVTTERIQSGHCEGRPGTSLRANAVICDEREFVDDTVLSIVEDC